jgi:isopenicillin-N epimerase
VNNTPAELRPLFLIDEDVHFLNHGSFGACPRPVMDVYQAWQRELERQPVAFLGRRYFDLMRAARARLAAEVGSGVDDLVYVTNATTGMNLIARSLDLGPGDEVLLTDHEYGACERTWRFVCRRRGATLRTAAIDAPVSTPQAFTDALWSAVGPRTRVLVVSHITSPTALVLPVEDLVRRAREAGVLTVIDGAHGPGQLPLDLRALGADFYLGNCHKWMCGPKGAGFVHARPEAQALLEPLIVGWGWEPEAWRPSTSPFIDQLEHTGTRDLAPFLAVPAAIDFLREHDWSEVRARCARLLREARARLLALPGVEPLHPDDPIWTAQMEAVTVPWSDPFDLATRLYESHKVEVPIYQWNDRTVLRVSIQGYNDRGDVDALLEALEAQLIPRTVHAVPSTETKP